MTARHLSIFAITTALLMIGSWTARAADSDHAPTSSTDSPPPPPPLPTSTQGASKAGASRSGNSHGENIINFDADVIEGEKRVPDLFLQIGKQQQDMESVIYSRQDFNDFHQRDRHWRPKSPVPVQNAVKGAAQK